MLWWWTVCMRENTSWAQRSMSASESGTGKEEQSVLFRRNRQLGLYITNGNVLLFSEPTPHPFLFQLLSWHIQHQRADAKGKSPSLAELHSQPSWHVLCGVSQSHSARDRLCSSPCNPITQIDIQCSNLCHMYAGLAYGLQLWCWRVGRKKTFFILPWNVWVKHTVWVRLETILCCFL